MSMIRQKQLIRHDPDNGKFGDCYRTSIAMLMGMSAEDLPNFADDPDKSGLTRCREWLRERDLGVLQVLYPPELELDAILSSIEHLSPGIAVIITGRSPRGDWNHCIVALNGKVFCDPATGKGGEHVLTGPAENDGEAWWWVETIVRLPGQACGPAAVDVRGIFDAADAEFEAYETLARTNPEKALAMRDAVRNMLVRLGLHRLWKSKGNNQ